MNYSKKALLSFEKQSGLRTIKPYRELLIKAFSLNWPDNGGSLFQINQILIEYLDTLEKLDLKIPNYDFHINYSLKIEKIELLPLFGKLDLSANITNIKEFQFIYLTLKIVLQLFMDFSEKLLLLSNSGYYKKIINYERVYITSMFKFIKILCQNNLSGTETDTLKKYQFAYDTLDSGFSNFLRDFPFTESTNNIIKKIQIRNNELHSLTTKIAVKRSVK